MISSHHRFHGQTGLQALFKKGQSLRTEVFVLRYAVNHRRTGFRLAVVISKKVNKKAVVRNRIRRRLYELFRNRLSDIDPKVDLAVIVLKNELAEISSGDLQKIFEPAFEKILAHPS